MKKGTWLLLAVILVIGFFYFTSDKGSETVVLDESNEAEETEEIEEINFDDIEGDRYVVNTSVSTLEWAASRITGGSHEGTVDIASGNYVEQDGEFIAGEFIFDMTTMSESKDNKKFLDHIASEDFFNVENFSTSKLKITSVEMGEYVYIVKGELTILGQTHEIDFDATIEHEEDLIDVVAELEIDRTKWGIEYDSGSIFKDLGDRAIRDEIMYKLHVVLEK